MIKKSHLIIFVGGALVAVGMILSYIGATYISEQVTMTEGIISSAIPVTVEKELDPSISTQGAFIIRAESEDRTNLSAVVFGPFGEEIKSLKVSDVSTEEYFNIESKGLYKIQVKNSGKEMAIIVGITHAPEKSIVALNMLGQSMIISGFVGVGIAVIYAIKTRKSN